MVTQFMTHWLTHRVQQKNKARTYASYTEWKAGLMCIPVGKRPVGASAKPCSGSAGPGHNGACCRASMATGTASASASLDGNREQHGIWQSMYTHFVADPDLEHLLIDSTVVQSHPCAAGAAKKDGGQAEQALSATRHMTVMPCVNRLHIGARKRLFHASPAQSINRG
jgi:hypothetical protein